MNYKVNNIDIYINGELKQYNLLVGKNAKGNDEIIKIAKNECKEHIWFHFDNLSGPHIILCTNGDIIDKKNIKEIAKLLFLYKSKAPKNTNVIYTEIKNVLLTKTIGMVNTNNIKTITF